MRLSLGRINESSSMRFILKITIFSIFLASPIFAANVRLAQTLLNDLNYSPGTIDGQYGEKTKDALVRFYDLKNMKFGVE